MEYKDPIQSYNNNQQQLQNLYYNLGFQATDGVEKDSVDTRFKPQTYSALDDDRITQAGKYFATTGIVPSWYKGKIVSYGARPSIPTEEGLQKYKDELEWKLNRDWKTSNKAESIGITQKNLADYQKKLEMFQGFQSNLEKIRAGESIERQNPYEGYTFDRTKGYVKTVEPLQAQEKNTQNTSGGFAESVSSFGQNVQQFGQNVLNYGQRVLAFPKSRQFNPTGFIHTQKLTQ